MDFSIKAQYDKSFYISAKIADDADDVFKSNLDGRFHVLINTQKFELIEQLYYNNQKYIDWVLSKKDQNFILSYSILGVIKRASIQYQKQKDSYSMMYNFGWMYLLETNLRKKIELPFKNRNEKLYCMIKEEGRVNIKWKREYELFISIKTLYPDAIFQYRVEEMDGQSFDIFIPNKQVAIEYQGKQHYEAINFFGGEEQYQEQLRLDAKKQEYAQKNDIVILHWKYTYKINRNNFLDFLNKNAIYLDFVQPTKLIKDRTIEMAPTYINRHKTEKRPKQNIKKRAKYIICQYDFDENLLETYDTITEAAQKVGVSTTSIGKVINGKRKSAAGYIWKRKILDI